MGQSTMKPDVSTEIVAVPSSCASMHESHYWPTSDAIDGCSNPTYNCLKYELNDGTHVVASTDDDGTATIAFRSEFT